MIAGPIFEDMIYRGLVMTALEKGKKWGLDVLGSAVLFGVSHISNHGWVLTDFVFYMGGGLIFAVLFRMTKSIYWPIGWTAYSLQWHWSAFDVTVILVVSSIAVYPWGKLPI